MSDDTRIGEALRKVLAPQPGLEQRMMDAVGAADRDGNNVRNNEVPLFCGPLKGLVEIATRFNEAEASVCSSSGL